MKRRLYSALLGGVLLVAPAFGMTAASDHPQCQTNATAVSTAFSASDRSECKSDCSDEFRHCRRGCDQIPVEIGRHYCMLGCDRGQRECDYKCDDER